MAETTSIEINERWEIRAGAYDWVLVEHIPKDSNHHLAKNNGKATKEYNRHYPSVKQCCMKILNETGKEDCHSASDLIENWMNITNRIEKVFENGCN